MKKRAVFLDRDGTINVDIGYPGSFAEITIYPESYEAVRKIRAAGFLAVVVTNQSGVGRGLFSEDALRDIHQNLIAAMASRGAPLDAIYYCPHYDRSERPEYRRACSCRKPATGLALRAAADFDIDLRRSYMIGDKVEDILFGLNAGMTPVLVRTGFGAETEQKLREMGRPPAAAVGGVLEAVNWILDHDGREHDSV
jgi:D-glycero-D-manno-heptose 1,7-bisphosphate phosphatase